MIQPPMATQVSAPGAAPLRACFGSLSALAVPGCFVEGPGILLLIPLSSAMFG